jgi:alpha-mannosidase
VDEKGLFTPAQAMDNRYVFVARDVPAWGTKTYTVVSKTPKSVASDVVHVTEHEHVFNQTFVIDTRTATVQVSKNNGTIASFIVKPSAADLVPYGVPRDLEHVYISRQDLAMNLFQFIDERPNQMSAWLINSTSRETNLVAGAKVSVVETGPVFARLRVEHSVRQSSIRQDMIYNELARVDLDMTIDWRERGNPDVGVPQLKLSFNATVPGAKARFEGPFVVAERPCDGIDQPTQKFVDVSGEGVGYTVFNDSKYGVDVLGGRCRVTLLRNPYGPDGEPDNGVHRVRLSFVPHEGGVSNEQLVKAGMTFNRPMPSASGSAATKRSAEAAPAVQVSATGVVAHSLRRAEHSNGWIVRLVETNGQKASGTFTVGGGVRAVEVDFHEAPLKKARPVKLVRGKASLTWRPFEVKTLLLCR